MNTCKFFKLFLLNISLCLYISCEEFEEIANPDDTDTVTTQFSNESPDNDTEQAVVEILKDELTVEEVCKEVTTDKEDANLDQFLGKWYEISSFREFFNVGCTCTTATYTLSGDKIKVTNRCKRLGFSNKVEGTARMANENDFSKLEVSFPFNPRPGEYWILEFAKDASYMMVGDSDRTQLYILCKTPQMDQDIYNELIAKAHEMCFDIKKLILTDQKCNI